MAIGSEYKLKYRIDADTRGVKAELSKVDSMFGSLGSGLSGIAGPAAIGAAGVAAIGAAAVAAGLAIFNLTKQAADFGSAIFDASEKTGLHAESLSAMKFAADQSGSSLEQVTSGLAKFAKNVGQAGDDAKTATKFFADFGITPQAALNDLDGALGKVFKRISDAKPGIEQITLAQKAFGKSGADLLPFIKSFDGDLEALTKRAKELGVTIDDDAAKAADEFGDQLDTLSAQLSGVARTIVSPLIPKITELAETFSDFISENKDDMEGWASKSATMLSGVAGYWYDATTAIRSYITAFERLTNIKVPEQGFSTFRYDSAFDLGVGKKLLDRGDTGTLKASLGGRLGLGGRLSSSITDSDISEVAGGGKGTGGRKAATKIKSDLPAFGSMKTLVISSGNPQWDAWFTQMGQKYGVDPNVLLLQAGKESSFNSGATSPKGAKGFSQFMPATAERFGVDTSSVKDSIRGQAQYMGQLLSEFGGDYKKALAGYNAGEGSVRRYKGIPPFKETQDYVGKISSQYSKRVRKKESGEFGTYDFEADAEAAKKLLDEEADYAQQVLDEWVQSEREASDDRLAIRRAEADLAEEILQSQVDAGILTETEYAERVGQLRIDMLEEEKKELGEQISTRENINKIALINLEIDKQLVVNAAERVRLEKKSRDERIKSWAAYIDHLEEVQKLEDDNADRNAEERRQNRRNRTVGSGQEISSQGQLHDFFSEDENTLAIAGIDALSQAFEGLGQAVGQAVYAYTLYGSAGQSVREVTAQILAGIAQQAAIKAIFELAEGFAALAMSFFGIPNAGPSAAAHFAAAAIYGGIAGVAAVAGRVVAGDSMKGGGSGSGSSGAGGKSSKENDRTGSASQKKEDLLPSSRQDENTFISGRRGKDDQLADAINALNNKLGSMRPGDVVTAGVRQSPGLIGSAVVSDMGRNASIGTTMRRKAGLR